MKSWLKGALDNGWVKKCEGANQPALVSWTEAPTPHDPTAIDSHDGVIFDWSNLHRALVKPTAGTNNTLAAAGAKEVRAFNDFLAGTENLKETVVTTVSLDRPWTLIPLNEAASTMSQFSVSTSSDGRSATVESGNENAEEQKEKKDFYTFCKGPPAQRPATDSITQVLNSVVQQLKQQGVVAFVYLADVVIVSKNFDEALHRTAAVHKALKGAGLSIDGPRSCMIPRAVAELSSSAKGGNTLGRSRTGSFTSLDTRALKPEAEAVRFVADAFTQWAVDCYHWGCQGKVEILSDVKAMEAFVSDCLGSDLMIVPEILLEVEPMQRSADDAAEVAGGEGNKKGTATPAQVVQSIVSKVQRHIVNSAGTTQPSSLSKGPPGLGGASVGLGITPSSGGGAEALRPWSRWEVRLFVHWVYKEQTLGFFKW